MSLTITLLAPIYFASLTQDWTKGKSISKDHIILNDTKDSEEDNLPSGERKLFLSSISIFLVSTKKSFH